MGRKEDRHGRAGRLGPPHDHRWRRRRVHQPFLARGPQPGDRGARRSGPGRDRGRCRSGRGRRPGRVPGRALVADGAPGPGRRDEPAGRPVRQQCRRAGADRDPPDRDRLQAAARVGLRLRLGQPALLRRPDPASRGQGRLRVHREPHVVRPAGADRGRRPGRAVELPVLDGDLEGRTGARGRQLGGPQAGQRDADHDRPPGRARARGGRTGRGSQRRHRPRRRGRCRPCRAWRRRPRSR